MHHDVTLNYIPANTNQRYSNSLLSPSGVYLFQAHSMRSELSVARSQKERGKKWREIRDDHPLSYPRNFSCSDLFASSPQSELTPGIGWAK